MADNPPVNYDGRESEEPQIWSMEPFRRSRKKTYVHNPCGHWHLPVPTAHGCLEYVATAQTYPVYNWYPQSSIIGSDRKIYCIMGANATAHSGAAKAYVYNLDLSLYQQKDYAAADDLDVVYRTRERGGYLWVLAEKQTCDDAEWIFQIDMSDLSIVSQRIPGDCVAGTDGNNYCMTSLSYLNNTSYGPIYRPVTGLRWEYRWVALPAGYAYHVYADYTVPTGYYGSDYLVDFLMDDNYFYTNSGRYKQNITKRDYNMQFVARALPANGIGMGEMCFSPDESLIAFTGSSLYIKGYSNICIFRASDLVEVANKNISGGGFYSNNGYQNCLLWHENGYIYHTQGRSNLNGTPIARVIKIDSAGNVVATYENNSENGNIANSRIVASATHIYWWQDGYGDDQRPGIIKLDLDLNFVCFEPFHFTSNLVAPYMEERGFGFKPLLIDRTSHMIFSAYENSGAYFHKWDYYA